MSTHPFIRSQALSATVNRQPHDPPIRALAWVAGRWAARLPAGRVIGLPRVLVPRVVGAPMPVGCASAPPPPKTSPGFAPAPRPDSPFTPTEDRLRAAQGAQASGFHRLRSNLDALRWRLVLIDSARHTLDLQHHVWFTDKAGQLLMARVLAAAGHGVKVRVLFGDLNTRLHGMTHVELRDALLARLDQQPHIEIRLFNAWQQRDVLGRVVESLGNFQRLNRRMHNKQRVAHNQAAIIGGRNIGDEYVGLNPDFNFHDLDVLAVGPAAHAASTVFDRDWNSDWVRGVPRPAGPQAPVATPDADAQALAALASDPRARSILAGHHHGQSLGLPSCILLRGVVSPLAHPLVYLSAHTHRGFWAVHRALDWRPWLALNVSSLSDWPVSCRRIGLAFDDQANRLLVRGAPMPRGDGPIDSDADLMAAWEAQACAQGGPVTPDFYRVDRELVLRQRPSRGSLIDWAVSALAPVCERCGQLLCEHAHAHQDAMLDAIMQVAHQLGPDAHRLCETRLPAWCGGADFIGCVQAQQGGRPQGFAEQMALFRRKAVLVDVLGSQLDDLRSPQALACMTCRAVQAARIDFDLTDDARNNHRGESKRRAEQFFRLEASVGMG